MMQTAARDKADAVAAYRNVNRDLAEVVRLRNQIRRAKKTTAAPQDVAKNGTTVTGEHPGETEKESSR
jgi:hypothetical protein